MVDTKQLVSGILQFLSSQQTSASLEEDAKESLEVASQCLETAYGVTKENYTLPASVQDLVHTGLQHLNSQQNTPKFSDDDKTEAELLKSQGNDMMKADKIPEAVGLYTQAINRDPSNAVYYCNRAAAYSRQSQHQEALSDCNKALSIDPNYSKAFGRKGLALSALGKHQEASESFKRALELDPSNESYKNNMELAQQKAKDEASRPSEAPSFGGLNLGGMDLGGLLQNPALMNMATSMMSSPQMQQMMTSMMSGGGVPGVAGEQPPQDLSGLLQAGQQLASQMQSSNPELVEQLRQQCQASSKPPPSKDSDTPDKS